ncbi:N-acetylmuramoyl-L-alanine amidase [Sutcliffiella cohnii]
MKQVGFNKRGKKRENFHVLRETLMLAVLSENGFIDNPSDAVLSKNSIDKIKQSF